MLLFPFIFILQFVMQLSMMWWLPAGWAWDPVLWWVIPSTLYLRDELAVVFAMMGGLLLSATEPGLWGVWMMLYGVSAYLMVLMRGYLAGYNQKVWYSYLFLFPLVFHWLCLYLLSLGSWLPLMSSWVLYQAPFYLFATGLLSVVMERNVMRRYFPAIHLRYRVDP